MDSKVSVTDTRVVVRNGRELCHCFDNCDATSDEHSPDLTWEAFDTFHNSLYGAGFVMGDFDGPSFGNCQMRWLFKRELASQIVHYSDLFTMRMFLHTMARGFRFTFYGSGHPYFDDAYASGGLLAIIDRLEMYCDVAASKGWEYLKDADELYNS